MTKGKDLEKNETLSNSALGRSWLSQFDNTDREAARLLLDSILYVSNEQLVAGLRSLILDFFQNKALGPIALFVARENTGDPYWSKTLRRPQSVAGRLPVGSEGMLSNLCRDIAKTNKKILDHPSIREIRNSRCRHILCIDDMVGSGSRMVSFGKWLYKNKTIRSWHSLHYINFFACSYAASDIGQQHVSKSRLYSSIQSVQSIGSGRSIWSRDQKDQIEELCESYAYYTSRPMWPLGFQNAFTCIVFSHKCPNTNPPILWASKVNSWNAIFSDRPEFITDGIAINRKIHSEKWILKALGHTRILDSFVFNKLSSESRQLLTLLSCLAAHRHRDSILSDILELPLPVIRQQVECCLSYGWIDSGKRLTMRGKKVLVAARRTKCIQEKNIELKNDFYYPQSFRSPASLSSSGLRTGECHEC
jgi:hypothetical protein